VNETVELLAVRAPKLRAALDFAIDREALVNSIWDGKAEPASSYQFDTYSEELRFPDREDITYDPDLARQLVEESSYNGETIRIYNTTDYYTYADLAAQAIIDMWDDIGVSGQLVQVDSVSDSDNEELEIRTWSNPLYYNDPMGVIERHWSPTGEAVNLGHFTATDDYSDAFHTVRYDLDEEARAAALEEVFDYYREQTPFIYLYMPYESLAMRANINYTEPNHLRPYQLSFRAGDISETTT
jgi:peptide/nickel transport system substrate-binding protein